MMKLKPFRDEAPEDLLGVGALGHELDVGDVRVGDVLAEVLEALVVGLAPAAVVVRPDQDHRDVELAGDDVRDLEAPPRCRPWPAPAAQSPRRAAAARGTARLRRRAACADDDDRRREQARQPQPCARHGSSSSPPRRLRRIGRVVDRASPSDARALGRTARVPVRDGQVGRIAAGDVGRRPIRSRMRSRTTAVERVRTCPARGRRTGHDRPVPSAAMFERTALPAGPRVISARLPGRAFGLHRGLRPRRLAPRDARARPASPTSWSTSRSRAPTRYPVDAGDLRGDRGRRRLVQRRHRPRVDRLLGPRPAPRGDPGDGRPRRADRPADASTTTEIDGERTVIVEEIRSYLDDPAEYAQILFQQAMFGDGPLGPRDLRRRGRHPGAARGRRSATSGGRRTGRPTRSSPSPATSTTTRRVELAAAAFGTGQRRGPGLRRRRRRCRPASARSCRPARHDPGPARSSASRRSAATTPTRGSWPSSTRSSATG